MGCEAERPRVPAVPPWCAGLLCALACGGLYLLVFLLFLNVPLFNGPTLVRPADGLGPALGLFFGWPAVAGCAVAAGIGMLVHTADVGTSVLFACAQAVYLALPYVLWGVAMRRSGRPAPRFDTAAKVALYLGVVLVDSGYAALVLSAFEPAELSGVASQTVSFLNSLAFLTYVGLPAVLLLGRTGLAPTVAGQPRAWRVPRTRMTLGELVVGVFLLLIAVVVLGLFAIAYGPYLFEGALTNDEEWGYFITSSYFIISEVTVVGLVFMVLVARYMERHVSRPVESLTVSTSSFLRQLERRDGGDELVIEPVGEKGMRPSGEVRELIDAVNAMRDDLVGYIDRLAAVTAERERAEAELDIAREIQRSAVPHDFSDLRERHSLSVSGFMRPAREVGGDFYDVFEVDGRSVAFVIGDVSGKGVPASLFMMRAQSLIRECLLSQRDVGVALTAANRGLCERNDAMLFVTAFVCVLDTLTGVVRWANAGHNPPSIRRDGRRSYLRAKPGLVLGALDVCTYQEHRASLVPGDSMMLYTDGVVEAADVGEALYGEKRFSAVLERCDEEGVPSLPLRVVADIDAFAGDAPQADDLTILSFEWSLPVYTLDVPNDDRNLEQIFELLERVVGDVVARGLATSRLLFELKMVCEELFVNVCRYGAPDGRTLAVHLALSVDETGRRVFVTLRDDGIAYDPLGHEVRMPTLEGPVGGLGIHLVLKSVDEASYERDGDQNVLRLVKSFV